MDFPYDIEWEGKTPWHRVSCGRKAALNLPLYTNEICLENWVNRSFYQYFWLNNIIFQVKIAIHSSYGLVAGNKHKFSVFLAIYWFYLITLKPSNNADANMLIFLIAIMQFETKSIKYYCVTMMIMKLCKIKIL